MQMRRSVSTQLLALLEPGVESDERSREDAIACFLSGGHGWRGAVKCLGGAFAEETKVKGS